MFCKQSGSYLWVLEVWYKNRHTWFVCSWFVYKQTYMIRTHDSYTKQTPNKIKTFLFSNSMNKIRIQKQTRWFVYISVYKRMLDIRIHIRIQTCAHDSYAHDSNTKETPIRLKHFCFQIRWTKFENKNKHEQSNTIIRIRWSNTKQTYMVRMFMIRTRWSKQKHTRTIEHDDHDRHSYTIICLSFVYS